MKDYRVYLAQILERIGRVEEFTKDGKEVFLENSPKRCKKSITSITPTLPSPLRGGGLGWEGKGHRR
jgi:hypothetical protein